MGSNPSKNEVVNIRISSSKARKSLSKNERSNSKTRYNCDPCRPDNLLNQELNQTIDQLKDKLKALQIELNIREEKSSQAEEISFSLQTQLDEREREILLLREELSSVQSARHSIDSTTLSDKEVKIQPSKDIEEKLERTVHAKDQYIKTLEEELNTMRQHTLTQNDRYQKKLKKLRGMMSKSRQDSSLKMFELKDENTKLSEENTKLQERLERLSLDSGECSRQGSATIARPQQESHDLSSDVIDNHDNPRMKLILELSEQVASLDAENLKLKQELRHCRKITEKVEARVQAKKNSGKQDIVVVDRNTSSCSWKTVDTINSRFQIGEKA